MPPDRGRASKACASCRQLKTRCYESEVIGRACLRCERLEQSCSLQSTFGSSDIRQGTAPRSLTSAPLNEDRLVRLEQTVSALVERLGGGEGRWVPFVEESRSSSSIPPATSHSMPGGTSAAPVFVIRDVASEVGVQHQTPSPVLIRRLSSTDLIADGTFSMSEATMLMELFQEHYGRWVAFNESLPIDGLLHDVRKAPLLFAACCLIAVRHMNSEATSDIAPRLFEEVRTLLSNTMLDVPQSYEYFQSSVILSMWSTTIGQTPLSIDGWLLSGIALQHSLASGIFSFVTSGSRPSSISQDELSHRYIWNHLCLAHLHYCVGTRRKPIISRQQVDICREVMVSDHVTNFETRMVAEVILYWIIHENCSKLQVDLPSAQASLHEWRQEWKFLFGQPRSQFIQMGFHFAQLLVYDMALKSRSAAVRESLLSEMVRLSAAIIQLALDTTDSRTKHLSDHVYHMITFAAVTLCRLLHMYDSQLAAGHNITELDSLILTLVTWLRSIGRPCHVAHTLGDVVAAFHEKLRPDTHPSPFGQAQDDIGLYFPELLGIETYDNGNFDLVPQWDPYIQSPST